MAQWIEHQIPVLRVGGSSPFRRAIKETSFVYQGKRGFSCILGKKRAKYGQIGIAVPLVYEGRKVKQNDPSNTIDAFFNNSGFTGSITFQPVEKFIFSVYNKAREGSDKSEFAKG